MNALTTNTAVTMTSLELVDYINSQRGDGESELRHDHFMAKVPKVLGEIAAPNFRGSYKGKDGTDRPCYTFPKREACLMAMSYSYDLQAKVFDRMTALEAQANKPAFALPDFTNPAIAARAWADQVDKAEVLAVEVVQKSQQLKLVMPKVEAFDLVAASKGAITLTEAAKVLGKKRAELSAYLHEIGWLYRQNGSWVAYDAHIRTGCLQYKEAHYTDDKTGMACIKPYCHITQKGMAKLALMLGGAGPAIEQVA